MHNSYCAIVAQAPRGKNVATVRLVMDALKEQKLSRMKQNTLQIEGLCMTFYQGLQRKNLTISLSVDRYFLKLPKMTIQVWFLGY